METVTCNDLKEEAFCILYSISEHLEVAELRKKRMQNLEVNSRPYTMEYDEFKKEIEIVSKYRRTMKSCLQKYYSLTGCKEKVSQRMAGMTKEKLEELFEIADLLNVRG